MSAGGLVRRLYCTNISSYFKFYQNQPNTITETLTLNLVTANGQVNGNISLLLLPLPGLYALPLLERSDAGWGAGSNSLLHLNLSYPNLYS